MAEIPVLLEPSGMAELALGGIEVAIKTRTRRECPHETSLAVQAGGVERAICETCGHISVRFIYELSGPVSRDHFARPADEAFPPEEQPLEVASPFLDEERIGLRRREQSRPDVLLLTA